MNKTISGAYAVGGAFSVARRVSEINYFLDENSEGDLHGFLQTEEGRDFCARFTVSMGCGDKPNDAAISRYCQLYKDSLYPFLSGARAALDLSYHII